MISCAPLSDDHRAPFYSFQYSLTILLKHLGFRHTASSLRAAAASYISDYSYWRIYLKLGDPSCWLKQRSVVASFSCPPKSLILSCSMVLWVGCHFQLIESCDLWYYGRHSLLLDSVFYLRLVRLVDHSQTDWSLSIGSSCNKMYLQRFGYPWSHFALLRCVAMVWLWNFSNGKSGEERLASYRTKGPWKLTRPAWRTNPVPNLASSKDHGSGKSY
mgnify:CR=1 FL=1